MRILIQLVKKDMTLFLKDKVAVMLTYALPLLVIFLFGSVLGVGGRDGVAGEDNGPTGPAVIVVNQSEDPLIEALIEKMAKHDGLRLWTQKQTEADTWVKFSEDDARDWILRNRVNFALVFPPDATGVAPGLKMILLNNPKNQVEDQMVRGLLTMNLFKEYPLLLIETLRGEMSGVFTQEDFDLFNTKIAEAVSEIFEMDIDVVREEVAEGNPMQFLMAPEPGEELQSMESVGEQMGDMVGSLFEIKDEQLVGQDVRNPQATRLIAGWAVMFLLFSMTGAASSLFDEKKASIFHRLFSGPVSRDLILYSKFVHLTLIGLSQLVFCFVAGWAMFGVEVFPFIVPLAVVSLVVGASCTAFGMFLSSISKTAAQANGFGTMLVLTMSAVGGAWFPVSLMPDWVQTLSKFTLVYWAVEGFQQVLWNQAGLVGALPYLGMLLIIITIVMAISTWRFRVGDLFS